MTTIEWSEGLSVGVHILDANHRFLINLIKKFNDAVESKQDADRIGKILDGIYEYTDFHFIREEVLMRACGYSDVDAHHKVHLNLCEQIKEICRRHAVAPSESLSAETRAFLNNWLTKHIMGQDKNYASVMVGKELEIAKAHAPLIHQYSVAESAEATDVY